MAVISWLVSGLIIGAIAKFLMPGKDPGGILVTILLGIAGAFVGSYLGLFPQLRKLDKFPEPVH